MGKSCFSTATKEFARPAKECRVQINNFPQGIMDYATTTKTFRIATRDVQVKYKDSPQGKGSSP